MLAASQATVARFEELLDTVKHAYDDATRESIALKLQRDEYEAKSTSPFPDCPAPLTLCSQRAGQRAEPHSAISLRARSYTQGCASPLRGGVFTP